MHRQPELKQDLLLKSAWVETQSIGKNYDKIFYVNNPNPKLFRDINSFPVLHHF